MSSPALKTKAAIRRSFSKLFFLAVLIFSWSQSNSQATFTAGYHEASLLTELEESDDISSNAGLEVGDSFPKFEVLSKWFSEDCFQINSGISRSSGSMTWVFGFDGNSAFPRNGNTQKTIETTKFFKLFFIHFRQAIPNSSTNHDLHYPH